MVEDLRPHESEPIGSVRTSAAILKFLDCIYYIQPDAETGQVEVQCCFVTYIRSNTTRYVGLLIRRLQILSKQATSL